VPASFLVILIPARVILCRRCRSRYSPRQDRFTAALADPPHASWLSSMSWIMSLWVEIGFFLSSFVRLTQNLFCSIHTNEDSAEKLVILAFMNFGIMKAFAKCAGSFSFGCKLQFTAMR
jgi:hypothetical protein